MNQNTLQPTFFLDFDESSVQYFAEQHVSSDDSPQLKAIKLFLVVRDRFAYDPYNLHLDPNDMKASEILKRTSGYCNEKAIVLASALRYHGIPARLYFGNVRNHIATGKLEKLLGTDLLAFHGCVEVWLDGRWLKATPAFNKELCEKLSVDPLEFNGREDAIFQQFSRDGKRFIEYVEIIGSFDDMPHQRFLQELKKHYGHLFDAENSKTFRLKSMLP
jgi:transglutaminase-like putative cysteine protease